MGYPRQGFVEYTDFEKLGPVRSPFAYSFSKIPSHRKSYIVTKNDLIPYSSRPIDAKRGLISSIEASVQGARDLMSRAVNQKKDFLVLLILNGTQLLRFVFKNFR